MFDRDRGLFNVGGYTYTYANPTGEIEGRLDINSQTFF